MSIFGLDDSIIKENSHVVMYTSPDEIQLIRVMRGAQFHSRLGHFKHDDMIDKEYGTKLFTVNGGERYVHLMRPTPELWTRCLPHRTQIIYTPDCAFITEMLDIKAGSKVVESGTGSGSFTHFLSRAVGPFGHIYTFDFHKARVDQARQEFEKHSLQNVVTIQFSDVCNNGFGLKAIADAGK